VSTVEVDISMSLDGFIAGPNLGKYPGLGEGGEILHAWMGEPEGQRIIADTFASWGAVVTSRAIYDGTGGWGEDPAFKMPVFVVTHRAHDAVVKGATSFTFATGGIEAAIAQARATAGEKKVYVMGGASIIQQALNAKLVDQLNIRIAPVLLGAGTPLFRHLDEQIALEQIEVVQSPLATHLRFRLA
jgi:dihydrofolate reductase